MDFGPFLFLATLEGLVQAAVLCITALGLSLVFGVMRIVNVAHGEFYMLGAVLAWWTTGFFSSFPAIGFAVAIVVCPLLAGLVAFVCERLVLRKVEYNPESTIVATIGILYIIQQTVLITFGPDSRSVDTPFYFRIEFPWFGYSGYKILVILAALFLLFVAWYVISRTRLGLIMRATQFDRETAQNYGININRVYAMVFSAGAALAAIAAVLIVPIQQAHYLMGLDPLLLSFIVVIIGGLGSIRGTLFAALIIGLSDGIISVFFTPTLAKLVSTMLVAMVLVFKPEGLFGSRNRL